MDVVVNRFTMQALESGVIRVKGGDQMRPHIYIENMADAYIWAVRNERATGIYNAGFENLSVMDVARTISLYTGAKILTEPSDDPRSYRLNSDRIRAAGFHPKHTVMDAVREMVEKYGSGELTNDPNWYSLETMKRAA